MRISRRASSPVLACRMRAVAAAWRATQFAKKRDHPVQALVLENFESSPVLRDIPVPPPPADHQVTIDVAACGLNFADLLMLHGKYQDTPAPPFVMGMEIAGTIRSVGAAVQGLAPGQRVAAFTGQGGLAETVTCDASRCVKLPDGMPMTQAAGFLIAYGTSHLALTHRGRLQQGETLVVLGAAGGVGLTAVELGAALGARVIAVARGAEKLKIARKAGAEICLDSETPGLRASLKELGGADVIFDALGDPLATEALRALRPEGRFLVIGFAAGKVPAFPANLLLVKNLTVMGFYWGGYLKFDPAPLAESLRQALDLYETGQVHPHVSHVLPLARATEGLELLRERKSTGKVVVMLSADD